MTLYQFYRFPRACFALAGTVCCHNAIVSVLEDSWCQELEGGRSMGVRKPREDRAEVGRQWRPWCVQVSKILQLASITV